MNHQYTEDDCMHVLSRKALELIVCFKQFRMIEKRRWRRTACTQAKRCFLLLFGFLLFLLLLLYLLFPLLVVHVLVWHNQATVGNNAFTFLLCG